MKLLGSLSIISSWKRRRRAALRRAMRGYRGICKTGQKINEVCTRLAETPLAVGTVSKLFFGESIRSTEIAAHQYLYIRQVLYKLPPALLAQFGRHAEPLRFPLPRPWQDSLAASGIPVARSVSSLMWIGDLCLYWCYGVLKIGRLLVLTATSGINRRYSQVRNFSHFEYITDVETPRPASDGRSFDVMSWYLEWEGRVPELAGLTFRGDTEHREHRGFFIRALETPVVPSLSLGSWIGFACWSVWAAALAVIGIIRGRWWYPLFLSEAAFGRLVRCVPAGALARDYLLNNSGWIYRPLWTYEAEARGSRILFYHYSTNSSGFKRKDGYHPEPHTWRLSNWPLHLVWDNHHADFVRRAVGAANVEVVGPIWFSSSPAEMIELKSGSIAVFDVQPFRPSRSTVFAFDFNYYTAETCTAFVRDVARACAETGFDMVWKRKRSIGKMAHPQYRLVAASLDAQSHVRLVPAEHSAIRVIERCCAAISLPFTSTALLAKHLGKPSCYYDPSGQLQKDDRAAHDIPILSSYDELIGWIRSVQNATPCPEVNRNSS